MDFSNDGKKLPRELWERKRAAKRSSQHHFMGEKTASVGFWWYQDGRKKNSGQISRQGRRCKWGGVGVVWLLQSKILGVGRSEAWGGGVGLCRRCWWPKKMWNNMRTPHVPLILGFLEPFFQKRKILAFCNCWGAKVWYFQTLEIGIRSPKIVCQWFWLSKTSSGIKMAMHVYIPFVCLR